MTVLYTETHLTTSPIYLEGNSACFSIALSSLTLQCHIHRLDNILYLQQNQVIQGDLVQLSGVFVTNADEPHFIKVHSIMLAPKDKLGKKRKLEELYRLGASTGDSGSSSNSSVVVERGGGRDDDSPCTRRTSPMSLTSSTAEGNKESTLTTHGIYQGLDIDTTQLFFMLYGQATFLTEQYESYYKSFTTKTPTLLTKDQAIRAKIDLLLTIFRQIYDTSLDLSTQIKVINFVSNVRTFMEKLNELKYLLPESILPPGINISHHVPLPNQIFQSFTRQ